MSDAYDPAVRKTYHRRTLRQLISWANGRPYHNATDDECCPDLSCCHPVLAEPSLEQRLKTMRTYAMLLQQGRLI